MCWARGLNKDGDLVGYNVPTTCSNVTCGQAINKGMDYYCGGLEGFYDGSAPGCGRYFCGTHLYYCFDNRENLNMTLCAECEEKWMERNV